MASHTHLTDNLRCSICLEIFKTPVVLQCSHSFCRACINLAWGRRGMQECPICRVPTLNGTYESRVLKDVCDAFREARKRKSSGNGEALCVVHGVKHELFCMDDKKLVCLECVSQEHKKHKFISIEEAAEKHKNKLLLDLGCSLKALTAQKSTFTSISTKLQGDQTGAKIRAEFEKLHQFLKEEEESRLSALKDEQDRKTALIKEKIGDVDRLNVFILNELHNVKNPREQDASRFLNNFKDAEKRCKITLPTLDSEPLIDVAAHTGDLRSRVGEKIKQLSPTYAVSSPFPTSRTFLF